MPDSTSNSSFNCTSFSYSKLTESGESLNPSTLDHAHGRGFAAAFPPPQLSATGSAASGRPRPRMVKLRKHSASQHARSRSRIAASEASSGFNPFRSGSETSDSVSHCYSTSNASMESSSGVEKDFRAYNGSSSNSHMKFGNVDFTFGVKRSESATVLNSEQGAAAATTEELDSINRVKVNIEKETELGNSDHMEFVFSANRSDIKSNSCQERRKTSQNATKTVSGGEGNMELESKPEHPKVDVSGFVLYADQNDLVSKSNAVKRESSKCEETSGFDDGEGIKFKTEVEFGKHDSFGSILGDNQGGKTSNLNVKKQEPLDSIRNSDQCVDTSSTKMETIGNSNRLGDRDDHLRYDDKLKSGYGSSNSISSSYNTIPASKLTGEMEKLNINDSDKVGGVDMTRDLKQSSVNNGNAFVFESNEKVCGSSSTSLRTNSDGQASFPDASFEDIGGENVKTCKRNNVQNGCGCNVASSFKGIPCSESSTRKEGVGNFHGTKIPEYQAPEDSPVNGATAPFPFSSFDLGSHPSHNVSKAHSMSKGQDKCYNVFTTIPEGSSESFTDFKPPTWDPSCFKENLFPQLDKKLDSTQKSRFSKEKGSKQMRRKLKLHSLNKKQKGQDHLSKESSSQDTRDAPDCYSPMDFSPYQDMKADDQHAEASAELSNPPIPDQCYVHSSLYSTNPTGYGDEYLDSVERGVDSNGSSFVSDSHSYGVEIDWPKSEQVFCSSVVGVSVDAGVGCNSNTEKQKSDQPLFAQGLGNPKDIQFSFSASPGGEDTSSFKRRQRKKNRRKAGHHSFIFSPNLNGMAGFSVQFSPSLHSNALDGSKINDQFKQGNVVSLATIQETCDKWRLRGNQAYKDGDLSKAEDLYTRGINSIPLNERSGYQIKPLLLCYSNRAATRMALGRIREALRDCLMATDVDPTFLKVQMRTANCHLLLGEVESAQRCFNKCLESGNVVCLDRRVIVEAAEGLQKAQKVAECINRSAEILKERITDAAGTALELLSEALSISLYSEKLLQMKAEALCLLQKYDSAVQLCEQSQHLAEKNFASDNSVENLSISTCDSYKCVRLWRWSVISRCYFHLGRLDESLNVIEKLQQEVSLNDKGMTDSIEDSLSLAASIRELLYQKNAGNEAFKVGKYTEAIEHYTIALSGNIKSRPFAAICFCNRAAAHQALGQITDAISDSSVAMALDGNYVKAISRRVALHEMVRDYGQAACDLRRVISILENQSDEKAKQSAKPSGSNGGVGELREARQHLLSVEELAKKGIPLNLYLILGIKESDTGTDIKKAYHKAALRHHPDKAGQLIARSEIGDEGQIWKEILQEVHKDADRLFKMIGEAYAVLSDPAKRTEYDLEEEIRKATKQSNRGSSCRRSSDVYGYGRPSDIFRSPFQRSSDVYGYGRPSDIFRSPFQRSSNRRHGRDTWKTHGNSYSRW